MTQPQMTADQMLRLAMQQHQVGQIARAETIYRQILSADPNNAEALHLAGVAAHQLGRSDEALDLIRRAIRINPSAAHYLCNFGQILASRGKFEEAAAALQSAVSFQPSLTDAHYNLGIALQQLGRMGEAAAALKKAIAQRPQFPDAWNTLGAVLQARNKSNEAIAAFQEAIKQQPGFADAYYNLGHALRQAGREDESVAAFRKSIELNPNQPDAYNSAGVVLYSQGKLDEALVEFHRALELKPDFAEAHNNVGLALQAKWQHDRAAAAYRDAIAVRPDYALAHHNLSTALLVQGDFEHGWVENEWRWKVPELGLNPRQFSKPLWDGSELKARSILLHADQGLGDTIQFVRYAPLVARRGGIVTLAVPASLRRLVQSMPSAHNVLSLTDNLPDFDVHCPLASLPLKFQTTLGSIPASTPYLFADPGKIRLWRARLKSLPGLKIGLAWSGRNTNPRRSIPIAELAPLAEVGDASFVSLQMGRRSDQPPQGMALSDWTSEIADFSDTAALIEALDLVISIDTSVAHLAGALNKTTWLLLPFAADWRWLQDRSDSPWYPSMRLFRQTKIGNWETPVDLVAQELRRFRKESD